MLKALLDAGADAGLKNKQGKTALDVSKNDEVKAVLQEALAK